MNDPKTSGVGPLTLSTPVLIPLVGSHFHPPAKQVLQALRARAVLSLVPEPDNPYDENAVRVEVVVADTLLISDFGRLCEVLDGTGFDPHDVASDHEPLHLGYIPRSGAKTAQGGPGNIEVLEWLSAGWGCQTASLAFDHNGAPCVLVGKQQ